MNTPADHGSHGSHGSHATDATELQLRDQAPGGELAEVDPDQPADETGHADQTGHVEPEPERISILLYSSSRTVRSEVRLALGRRVARDLPEIEVLEVATQPAVLTALDRPGIDLVLLDGEASPGGMGICRQLKDEIFDCPPVLVLTGRPDDAWLATWSRADAAVPHPVDPLRLPQAVATLLRASRGQTAIGA